MGILDDVGVGDSIPTIDISGFFQVLGFILV